MESFLKVHLHLDACSIPFRTTFHDKMSSISMNPQNYFRNNNNTSTPNRPMLCGRCRGRSTARRAAAPSRSTRGRSAWATSATTMKRWPRSGWRRTYGTRPNGSSRSRKVHTAKTRARRYASFKHQFSHKYVPSCNRPIQTLIDLKLDHTSVIDVKSNLLERKSFSQNNPKF